MLSVLQLSEEHSVYKDTDKDQHTNKFINSQK